MNYISEKITNIGAYGLSAIGITLDNFETIKSIILFLGALILLILQIKLHLIKIKKEKDNK